MVLIEREDTPVLFWLWLIVTYFLAAALLFPPLFAVGTLCLEGTIEPWKFDPSSPTFDFQLRYARNSALGLSFVQAFFLWTSSVAAHIDLRTVPFILKRLAIWFLPGFAYVTYGLLTSGHPDAFELGGVWVTWDPENVDGGTQVEADFFTTWNAVPSMVGAIAVVWVFAICLLDVVRLQWRYATGKDTEDLRPFRDNFGGGIREEW